MNVNRVTRKYFLQCGELEKSITDLKELIRKYGFYSRNSNPEGKGIHASSVNAFALYHNKKIVYDRLTGLCWQRSGSTHELSWNEAFIYAVDLSQAEYGGLRGWFLPSLAEALSLVEPSGQNYNREYPHLVPLHINPIFDATQRWIWTQNTTLKWIKEAWYVQFAQGDCEPMDKTSPCYVRAVTSDAPSEDKLEEISQVDLEGSIKPATTSIFDFSAGKCDFCKGTGKQSCQMCGSSGSITRSYPSAYQTITMTISCPNCSGSGFVSCSRCHGSGQA